MVCDGSMKAQILERPVLGEPQLSAAEATLRRLRRSRLSSCDHAVRLTSFLLRPPRERAPATPWWALAHRSRTTSFHERLIFTAPQQRTHGFEGAERDPVPAHSSAQRGAKRCALD